MNMLNKIELEKIIINSEEELKQFEGENIANKHLIINEMIKTVKLGNLENCIVEGTVIICDKLTDCNVQNIADVYCCSAESTKFDGCYKIQFGDIDEKYNISNCTFLCCRKIIVNDADITDCSFDRIGTIFLTNSDMAKSIITDVRCEAECVISMEDGELSAVTFENIELYNASFLIEGYGEPWIENCSFVNVSTSRNDKDLFHQEETKGILFKRTKEYSFVDEESCTGLSDIKYKA